MNAQASGPGDGPKPIVPFTVEIEAQRRQVAIAMSIVDACRLANDSMLVPMYTPADPDAEESDAEDDEDREVSDLLPDPDLEGALAMVWIILNGVNAQLEELMCRYFEDELAKAEGDDSRDGSPESCADPP